MNVVYLSRRVFLFTYETAVFLQRSEPGKTATPLESLDVAVRVRFCDEQRLEVFADLAACNGPDGAGMGDDTASKDRRDLCSSFANIDNQAGVPATRHKG